MLDILFSISENKQYFALRTRNAEEQKYKQQPRMRLKDGSKGPRFLLQFGAQGKLSRAV